VTGSYILELTVPIKEIYLLQSSKGQCTYSYESLVETDFGIISNITYIDVPVTQFIGATDDLRKEMNFIITDNTGKEISNPKMELVKLYYIKATRREWVPLFTTG